jgi:hypothetical protein
MPNKPRTIKQISKVAKKHRTPKEIQMMQAHRKSINQTAAQSTRGTVSGTSVSLGKGLGKQGGQGIPGSIVGTREDGSNILGKNQFQFEGKTINQKHFGGFVKAAGGVGKARAALSADPSILSSAGMTSEQAEQVLGSIQNRNRKVKKAQSY